MSPSRINIPTLSFKRLHPTFAVEVEGIDWCKPVPQPQVDEIVEAINREGLLVFRNANLDNEQHIAFSRQLGDLDDVKVHIRAGRAMRFPEQPEIFDVSNLDQHNAIIADQDPGRKETSKGNNIWHADMAFNPRRALYSLIRAVELPPKGTGGETQYADSRTAYDDLSPEMKERIEPLICNNSLFHNRKLASPEFFKDVEPLDSPMSRHRVVVPHDGSARKNLYITTYVHHFDGETMEESKPLIDELLAHATQPRYVYTVEYENDGDMVMWDNTAVLHRATAGGAYVGRYRRDMRRTTVKDHGKYAWGENEPGTTWQAGLPTSFTKKE